MRIKAFILFTVLLAALNASGQNEQQIDSLRADSVAAAQFIPIVYDSITYTHQPTEAEILMSLPIVQKMPSWMSNYLISLLSGNVDRTREKKVDLALTAIPTYTREAGWGLSGIATGLYRANRNDTLPNPSDFFVQFNASLNGFYVLTIKGNHLFTDNRSRLSYKSEIYRKNLDFWGITAQETAVNPKTKYDRRQIDFQFDYTYKLNNAFDIGAQLRCDYTNAYRLDNPDYLLGKPREYYVTGLGLSIQLDTRDNLVTPTRGVHIAYKPMIYPQFAGNAHATFHSHNIIANYYQKLWKGSVLAFDFFTKLNSSETPWTMYEMMASDGIRMRGYYMGSTIDKNQITAQVELRQHIWYRFGITAWGGTASLFPSINDIWDKDRKLRWQYNYGVGLRVEFKHNVNIRVDLGFGEHTRGVLFAIGEAF